MADTASPSGAPEPPPTLHIFGRPLERENGDICGEYSYVSKRCGYPAYLNRTTGMAIRFWAPLGRWVMDRAGIRDSDVCVAYAPAAASCSHPANPELIWHIWDSVAGMFLADDQVLAVDGPKELVAVGRDARRENSNINGKYVLAGVVHSRAAYRHEQEDLLIRYHSQEDRWLVSSSASAPDGTVCRAWADAGSSKHPADPQLKWMIRESEQNEFVRDPALGVVVAPEIINVLGRHPQAFNAGINGTYHLAGVYDGRPLYVHPGTQAVIRYSAKTDWWLIDNDGVAKPSVASRLYQWVMTGDADRAYDACSAWAAARGTPHPGHLELEWHVYEQAGERHKLDPSVAVTSAPLVMRVSGRDVSRENTDVNGDFHFVGSFEGCPVYQKQGSQCSMYFHKTASMWVIDRHGVRASGACVACAEAHSGCEHPASTTLSWQVWEAAKGAFVRDPAIAVNARPGESSGLPVQEPMPALGRRDEAVGPRGLKRGCGAEPGCVRDPHAPHAKSFRSESRGGSSWFGLFGA